VLKVRLIPSLLLRDGRMVKGVRFGDYRDVGHPSSTARVYDAQGADELLFLDITATAENRRTLFDIVSRTADECFMPLTVGGGVRTVEHVRRLLEVGADKVAINTAAVEEPDLIRRVAERFGAQCVVASIDVRRHLGGACEVYTRSGSKPTGRDPVELAREVEALGAGEILLTSIDRDGTMAGYDIPLTRSVSQAVSIPVIASGGAGSYEHMRSALIEGAAAAVAAASIYHYTHQTPLEAKRFLGEHGISVRL
jgi:cyclase